MKFICIQEAIDQGQGEVSVRGWVYRERGSSKFKFVVLRDATSIIQCVIDKNVLGKKFEQTDKIKIESSLEIRGELHDDKSLQHSMPNLYYRSKFS
jgi:aspartyl/asparaginyl-tRNA synthetase